MEMKLFCRTCGRGHSVILIAMSTPPCHAEIFVECQDGNHLERADEPVAKPIFSLEDFQRIAAQAERA